jgi:peptide-methionine (S)-S-oxide reductase
MMSLMYRKRIPRAAQLVMMAMVAAGALGSTACRDALAVTAAEDIHVLPLPLSDVSPAGADSAVAVVAGGCFWGVQGVFQRVKGVTNAVSGYAGGKANTAHYEVVGFGTTGHAESVEITYDPRQISYGRLLQIFFSVVHDPTEVNRQGPDEGPQYRSAVFPLNDEQARVANAYIAQLDQSKIFRRKLATKIEMGKTFYPAEEYHQDFLTRNPRYPYIVINDLPKIEALQRVFPDVYRAEPTLVLAKR